LNNDFYNLLNKYFLGIANSEEFAELEALISTNPDACREFVEYSTLDADLRSFALEGREFNGSQTKQKVKSKKSRKFPTWILSAAAAITIVGYLLMLPSQSSIGLIQESNSKLKAGSKLYPGTFEFESGSSTLKLNSGVDLNFSGPVRFKLLSDMRFHLYKGKVSVYVRESAQGFRIDTSFGHAIDHGTKFNVNVSEDNSIRFDVTDGEVSLHHKSGKENYLTSGHSSIMTEESISHFQILDTNGDEAIVVENPKRVSTDTKREMFLMVKNGSLGFENSRISFISFKRPNKNKVKSASLTLNYIPIPTKKGDRQSMPDLSEFVVYGIPDGPNEQWKRQGMTWKEATNLQGLQVIGRFKLKRETQTKTITIESGLLNQFISQDENGELSFVLTCKTPGGKMIHGFASSKNKEVDGPSLQLNFQ